MKSRESQAKRARLGRALIEDRYDLIVNPGAFGAIGAAEREPALTSLDDVSRPGTTVGDFKNYDTCGFVTVYRDRGVTPGVTPYPDNPHRGGAIDGRTTRHAAYGVSQLKRQLI